MYAHARWKAAGLDRMKVVANSCTLKSKPGEDGSVLVHARFTMRPDPNMDSIIGQTAHNIDEVGTSTAQHSTAQHSTAQYSKPKLP